MLCPLAVTEPDSAVESKETTIELVPDPDVIDAPAGTVHMYELAPVITGILYANPVCPWQSVVFPVMGSAGTGKRLTVTGVLLLFPSPQLSLCPRTVNTPLTALVLKLVVMLLVPVPLIIVHPTGRVQT